MPLFSPRLLHDGTDDLPVPVAPILQAVITVHSRDGDRIVISPDMRTASDIDEFVAQVKEDAEHFGRAAKHALDLAHSRSRRSR